MRPVAGRIRTISPEEIRRLKKATETAYLHAGGVSVLTLRCRASVSQLSKYASIDPRYEDTFIPLDVAVEVDRAAGQPVILPVLAEILGLELSPLVAADLDEDDISEMDAHRIGQKAMDLASEIFRALEDGAADALERRTISEKCLRLKRFVNDVLRRIV